MKIDISEKWLPVYEALASDVRLKIIRILEKNALNIKEISQELGLSSAIITMHIKKLEDAGIVKSERIPISGGIQKLCTLAVDNIQINISDTIVSERPHHTFIIPVGHYTDFSVTPTCGLATSEKVIGYFDDPRYFLDPERVNAKILWFTEGFVEYKIPNYLLSSQTPEELEISMELGSEAPGFSNNWPSDISFFFNGIHIADWTSPGDFGGQRGKLTPQWWNSNVNQYGLLKVLRVTHDGTYIDGQKVSNITLEQINIRLKQWTFRIGVLPDAKHVGGLTLYGSEFGNYDQDIIVRLYYS